LKKLNANDIRIKIVIFENGLINEVLIQYSDRVSEKEIGDLS